MNLFFGNSTKGILLILALGWLVVSFSSGTAKAEERPQLMDLQHGAEVFFEEIAPSIVQLTAGSNTWRSIGSGYVIDREGYCITNFHVTDGSDYLEADLYVDMDHRHVFQSGGWKATVIGEDPALDLGIIKIDAPSDRFHPVRLGDSSLMQPGDTVATFGSPGGDANIGPIAGTWYERFASSCEYFNLNLGVITEILSFEEAFTFAWDTLDYERAGTRDYGSCVQYLFHTDSAINHGNSGGPCVNVYGEAVGTNTWGLGGENFGMSVPINLLKRSAADIIEYGRVRRPWCGIALHPPIVPQGNLGNEMRMGLTFWSHRPFETEPDRLEIFTINPYSPAYAAGLRQGDIILEIDGQVFQNIFDVYSYFLNGDLGQEIIIEFERDNHGMPPALVTLEEKRTRYFGRTIEIYGWPGGSFDVTRYSSTMTY